MTVAQGIIVFLVAAGAVFLLAIRLDRYEDELERRFHLRLLEEEGGEAESTAARTRVLHEASSDCCRAREATD